MISENQAYLAGISEDAYLGVSPDRGYEFDLETRSEEWAELIGKRLFNETKKVTKTKRGNYTRIRIWSKELVTKLWRIKNKPSSILSEEEAVQSEWLIGFVDAEGSVTKTGSNQPMISIYNKNRTKLQVLESIMNKNGIHTGYYKAADRNVWQQFITGRKNLTRFMESYNLNHPQKKQRIIKFLDPKQSRDVG